MAKNKSSIYVITDLMLGNTAYDKSEKILILSAESVDLIEAVAAVAGEVHVYDMSFHAINRLRHYIRYENVKFFNDVYPTQRDYYDTALIIVPKGRDVGRAQLWSAMQALKTGGEMFLAGPTKGGARSLIKDTEELFGNASVLEYKSRQRVAVGVKEQFNPLPQDWGNPTEIVFRTLETPLGSLEVATMPGVFSWEALDEGTEFLLAHLDFRDAKTLLDVGCGYGIIGALAAKHVEHVTMLDDNLLAVRCAMETVKRNKLSNVEVIASNLFSSLGDEKYDLIVSNPPFHSKFAVSTNMPEKLIQQAPDHLNRGGRLLIVANAFLKYESHFSEAFTTSGVNHQNNKYKIMEGS